MEIKLQHIVNDLPVVESQGNINKVIKNIVSATNGKFDQHDILWVSDKNIDLLKTIDNGTIICSVKADRNFFNSSCTYLLVNNPRLYFLNVVKKYFVDDELPVVSAQAFIDPTVHIGKNVTIRPGVVIEKNCVIGDGSSIDANTVVKKGTIIGQRVKIGANNTIGGVGFGYEKGEDGNFELIPHIGNVVIEDDVEIGNNTAVDRAVLGSTILRRNSKVDNLVHIAHGVEVGENSLVIAHAMVAGSTKIGKNVWVAPTAAILNKLSVADNATIGMGAVVLKNVTEGQTVVGNPAKDLASLKKPAP